MGCGDDAGCDRLVLTWCKYFGKFPATLFAVPPRSRVVPNNLIADSGGFYLIRSSSFNDSNPMCGSLYTQKKTFLGDISLHSLDPEQELVSIDLRLSHPRISFRSHRRASCEKDGMLKDRQPVAYERSCRESR